MGELEKFLKHVSEERIKERKCHTGYPTMPNYMLATHIQGANYCRTCKTWYNEEPRLNASQWDYKYGRPIRKVLDIMFYIYLVCLTAFFIILILGAAIL
jgi:hypothetical protein